MLQIGKHRTHTGRIYEVLAIDAVLDADETEIKKQVAITCRISALRFGLYGQVVHHEKPHWISHVVESILAR